MNKKMLYVAAIMAQGLMICSTSAFAVEEKQTSGCVEICLQQKNTCYTIHVDKRICEVGYQECVAACDKPKQEDSKSPAQPKPETSVN